MAKRIVDDQEPEIINEEDAGHTDHCKTFFIIHHPQHKDQILFTDAGGLELPVVLTKPSVRRFLYEKPSLWFPKVKEKLGLTFDVILLRCIWYVESGYDCRTGVVEYRAILVLDSHGDVDDIPSDIRWDHFSHLCAPHPDAATSVRAFITERETSQEAPMRAPYACRGWFHETREWVEVQLMGHGYSDIRDLKQLKHTYRGTVFQVKTDNGVVYLKCNPCFVNEATIYEKLSALLPGHVETPIAIDVNKRLTLMRDYGDVISPMNMDRSESTRWAVQLAEIHQSTVGKEKLLQDAGLRVIPIESLPAALDDLLAYVEGFDLADSNVSQRVKQLRDQIRSDCMVVQKIGIPMTLIHGDLFLSNVYRPSGAGGCYGLIDWAEAAVSHPFFDVPWCSDNHAYLGSWQRFLSRTMSAEIAAVSIDRLFDCKYICTRLEPAYAAVRLYLERNEVEAPLPVAMREDLKGLLSCLARTYARNPKRIE